MQQIEYKYGFSTIKVGYARGIIEYKEKNVTEMEITGFGISIYNAARVTTGNVVGGLIGHVIARGGKKKELSKDIDLKTVGTNKLTKIAQLIIAYKKPHEEKVRALYVPINLGDPVCIDFLEKLKIDMRSKYIGVGNFNAILKELKISQKGLIIGVVLFILVVAGIIVFASLQGSY